MFYIYAVTKMPLQFWTELCSLSACIYSKIKLFIPIDSVVSGYVQFCIPTVLRPTNNLFCMLLNLVYVFICFFNTVVHSEGLNIIFICISYEGSHLCNLNCEPIIKSRNSYIFLNGQIWKNGQKTLFLLNSLTYS